MICVMEVVGISLCLGFWGLGGDGGGGGDLGGCWVIFVRFFVVCGWSWVVNGVIGGGGCRR